MNIKIERVKRNLSQSEVSELSGINQMKISRIERNILDIKKLSYQELEELAILFETTIDELVKGDEI